MYLVEVRGALERNISSLRAFDLGARQPLAIVHVSARILLGGFLRCSLFYLFLFISNTPVWGGGGAACLPPLAAPPHILAT